MRIKKFDDFISAEIKQCALKLENANYLERPVDRDYIRTKLLGRNASNTIESYLKETHNEDLVENFNEISNSIIAPGMNPHKPYEPESYFVRNLISEKLTELVKKFAMGENKFHTIVHLGNKGSGKTISQKIFLRETNKFMEKNRIFWVRCDVQKLYETWKDCIENSGVDINSKSLQPVTILDYLNIQALYVFVKYYDYVEVGKDENGSIVKSRSEMLNSVFNLISEQNIKREYYPSPLAYIPRILDIKKELERIRNIVLSFELRKKNRLNYSYALDEIIASGFYPSKRKGFNFWIAISEFIQSFMFENNYKIIYIVDGIDNVNLLDKNSLPFYDSILNQFGEFVIKRPSNYILHIATMRIRTDAEIQKKHFETRNTPDYVKKMKKK
ncbi:MAG: hypothetical protein IPN76_31960 [Saprospiraceae bacterium]|nr:hypothetical protein [Saprospiraceae bacterium]